MKNIMVKLELEHQLKNSKLSLIQDLVIYGFLHQNVQVQVVLIKENSMLLNQQHLFKMDKLLIFLMVLVVFQVHGVKILFLLLVLQEQMYGLLLPIQLVLLHSLILNLMEFQVWLGKVYLLMEKHQYFIHYGNKVLLHIIYIHSF